MGRHIIFEQTLQISTRRPEEKKTVREEQVKQDVQQLDNVLLVQHRGIVHLTCIAQCKNGRKYEI